MFSRASLASTVLMLVGEGVCDSNFLTSTLLIWDFGSLVVSVWLVLSCNKLTCVDHAETKHDVRIICDADFSIVNRMG